jgi:hypothetical protein
MTKINLPFAHLNTCTVEPGYNDISQESAVGIATRYELDGPGIESRWGARFCAPVLTGCKAHPASYTMGTGSSSGVKRLGRDVDYPPPLAPRLKKE